MADDLGFETLACNGNSRNRTPNLDRMESQGMRFTHAYATPLCTPTRVQLMTGKYNFRNYIGFGLLDKSETTFAQLLKEQGYVTAVTGKWQLLGNERQRQLAGGRIGSYPEEVGFDEHCLWQVDQLGSRYKDPLIRTNGKTKTHTGAYGPDVFEDFALNFIEKNRNRSFFLYYPRVLTHDPFQPTPRSATFEGFDGASNLSDTTYFKEMVEYMDGIVGRILDKVEELGIGPNTLIMFAGDNGTHRRVVSRVGDKEVWGNKGQTNKYGTHVPLIAYWKNVIQPGQVNTNLVDFTDMVPTFLDVAKAPPTTTDGVSLYHQLLGRDGPVREWVYCSYNPNWGRLKASVWAQNKRWKLYGDGRFYNVEDDPEERFAIAPDDMTKEAHATHEKLAAVIAQYAGH